MDENLLKSVIHGKPHVHVGKNGLSKNVIQQVVSLIEKKKIIKVKFLAYDEFNTIDEAVSYLTTHTKTIALDIRGKSVILRKGIS